MNNFIKYSLARVGESLRVNFGMFVKHNETSSYRGKTKIQSVITKQIKGPYSTYDVSLYPYVELDFSDYDDRKELAQSNTTYMNNMCRITLNKYNLYLFTIMLKKMERDFIVNKDLYYYTNGKLVLNIDKAKEISVDTIINDVRVLLSPIVVEVGGGEREHEGVSLAFRDISNFTQLTYTEMGYLRYVLDNVDLDLMAINLLKLVGENKIHTIVHNTVISTDTPNDSTDVIVEKVEEDNASSCNIIIKSENVIPDI